MRFLHGKVWKEPVEDSEYSWAGVWFWIHEDGRTEGIFSCAADTWERVVWMMDDFYADSDLWGRWQAQKALARITDIRAMLVKAGVVDA